MFKRVLLFATGFSAAYAIRKPTKNKRRPSVVVSPSRRIKKTNSPSRGRTTAVSRPPNHGLRIRVPTAETSGRRAQPCPAAPRALPLGRSPAEGVVHLNWAAMKKQERKYVKEQQQEYAVRMIILDMCESGQLPSQLPARIYTILKQQMPYLRENYFKVDGVTPEKLGIQKEVRGWFASLGTNGPRAAAVAGPKPPADCDAQVEELERKMGGLVVNTSPLQPTTTNRHDNMSQDNFLDAFAKMDEERRQMDSLEDQTAAMNLAGSAFCELPASKSPPQGDQVFWKLTIFLETNFFWKLIIFCGFRV